MDFKGLAAELIFFKNALEKIGVQPEVIRPSGNQFKSAVEPFILEKASEPNRLQYKVMMNSIWNKLMNDMHASTKIPVDSMNTWANNFSVSFPEEALKHKVVSRLTYQDEFMNALKKKLKVTDDDDLHIIEIEKYVRVAEKSTQAQSKDKIAVIYAEGEIVDGDGSYDEIGGDDFVKSIREAREDKDVKAIVLRVNSPGGSAAASEVIWRELSLIKGKKPLIVSMGNYAASGGYYISCLADSIIADHTTITGSIGVFGVMFNVQRMLNDKLGITTDTIKTHRYADFPNLTRPFTAEEKNILQRSVDQIYTLFLKRVSEGRKINVAKLDSIAQGRVWTGADALSIGLVDKLGGLNDAISMAAKKAKLTSYQLKSFPEPEDPFDMLFGEMSQTALHLFMPDSWIQTEKYYKQTEKLSKIQGLQTRMPYTFDLY
jgi:protease-4